MLRPAWAAFKVYFINLGFLDGKIGFILQPITIHILFKNI